MSNTANQISLIKNLRFIGMLEGLSYIFLLFIAMPIKYYAGMPEAVKYTGWVHGVLFVLFCYLVARVKFSLGWSYGWGIIAFIASLLPFGTFFLDRQLRKEEMKITTTSKTTA